ncbi:hypothetical protein [Polluticaenibacter yanchengensis]|uniref:Uncharacterized protein n=1 Tax=Polluticaenibacter yanchengensis TaxID=3014562 RepID=A0ABT4UIN8_9BACT|nr:hypothetical protein [Chitinophagaceae bacterium LY-5]
MPDTYIHDIPVAPTGYDLTDKWLMVHDTEQPISTDTKRVKWQDLVGSNYYESTRINILQLIQQSKLKIGVNYGISDAEPTLYGGTKAIFKAVSSNKLAFTGIGIFYVPKYDSIPVYEPYAYFSTMSITNGLKFQIGETITNIDGDTGKYIGHSIILPLTGNWTSGYITGATSGAEADYALESFPSYIVNNRVIWGGKLWRNITGNVGNAVDQLNLNPEDWELLGVNETNFNLSTDLIIYDIVNNKILSREDQFGNKVEVGNNLASNAIKYFQWGNANVRENVVIGSLFNIINFRGNEIIGNVLKYTSDLSTSEFVKESVFNYNKLSSTNGSNYGRSYTISSDYSNNTFTVGFVPRMIRGTELRNSIFNVKQYTEREELIDKEFTSNLLNISKPFLFVKVAQNASTGVVTTTVLKNNLLFDVSFTPNDSSDSIIDITTVDFGVGNTLMTLTPEFSTVNKVALQSLPSPNEDEFQLRVINNTGADAVGFSYFITIEISE